ncbi:MAG: hypothetical protein KKE20_07045, partial [Nanoarchaeota archaeon]|nr:hypothetical protein [Nanoarchaeota archaeon]
MVVFAVLCTTMVLAEDLMIQSFELDSTGEDIEVKPGETLKVSFDVVNVGTDDLEDIEVEMWFERSGTKLEDANGDKIRPTFDLNDIDAGDDKSVDYEFKIPWEVDDGDRWEIFVKLKARNPEDSSRIDFEENPGYFRVEKESHEVLVIASFEPNNIDCGDNVKLNVEVRNIGTNDEDDVNLTSVNKVIG